MMTTTNLSLVTAFAVLMTAPLALAQDGTAPEKKDGPMMQGNSMMGGDASGMMGMMKMMQQMAPMMAACTERMQVATSQPEIPETTPQGG